MTVENAVENNYRKTPNSKYFPSRYILGSLLCYFFATVYLVPVGSWYQNYVIFITSCALWGLSYFNAISRDNHLNANEHARIQTTNIIRFNDIYTKIIMLNLYDYYYTDVADVVERISLLRFWPKFI